MNLWTVKVWIMWHKLRGKRCQNALVLGSNSIKRKKRTSTTTENHKELFCWNLCFIIDIVPTLPSFLSHNVFAASFDIKKNLPAKVDWKIIISGPLSDSKLWKGLDWNEFWIKGPHVFGSSSSLFLGCGMHLLELEVEEEVTSWLLL